MTHFKCSEEIRNQITNGRLKSEEEKKNIVHTFVFTGQANWPNEIGYWHPIVEPQ